MTTYVNDNRARAEKARRRCLAVADEIEAGTLPFDRPGCYFDELLMAAALPPAQAQLIDLPELFDDIKPRTPSGASGEDAYELSDDDWSHVSDTFDDECRWDEWEVPLYRDHPLLPAVLANHHPYTWFDRSEGTGPGHRQGLAGLVRED